MSDQGPMFVSAEGTSGRTAGMDVRADLPDLPERLGAALGPYRLVRAIGEGGFGTVFLAEQERPVRRQVALKVIKLGMDTRHVIARFEAERQALALMDHPNVARVLDAGATPAGRPYFVMELVQGEPITAYCDRERMGLRARLELFVQVCQAIRHAHQKGVIHRDVKPSNVLVATHDGRPVAKVIDFGIAKATAPRPAAADADETGLTAPRQWVGTPQYMSPEQAEGNGDVDTRADVYSLGVLLYELLTGTTPFDLTELRSKGHSDVQRILREVEPPAPSSRLAPAGAKAGAGGAEALAARAAKRGGLAPERLRALVRGELDWIVMRCLEKDRSRRYESAAALAADVVRHLGDETVEACPPSATYRLRKFARRNRAALTTATLVAAAMVAGTAASLWQAGVARTAQGKAEASERAAVSERDRKEKALASEAAARRRAMAALRTLTDHVVGRQMARQPALTEEDREFLRDVLGHYEALAGTAGDTREAREVRAEGRFRVGTLLARLGRLPEARPAWERALELYGALAHDFPGDPDLHHQLAAAHMNLALALDAAGDARGAEAQTGRAMAIQQRLAEAFPANPDYLQALAMAHNNMALFRGRAADRVGAEAAQREALAIRSRLAERHPGVAKHRYDLAASHLALGALLDDRGERGQAERAYRRAAELCAALAGDFPSVPDYRHLRAQAHNNLLVLYEAQAKAPEAQREAAAALEIHRGLAAEFPTIPSYRQQLAMSHSNLASVLWKMGKLREAARELGKAGPIAERLVQEFPSVQEYRGDLADILSNHGGVLKDGQDYPESERHYAHALKLRQALAEEFPEVPEHRLRLARIHINLGLLMSAQGRPAAAEPHHLRALDLLEKLPPGLRESLWCRQVVGALYADLSIVRDNEDRPEPAREFALKALAVRERLVADHPEVPMLAVELAGTCCNLGNLAAKGEAPAAAVGWYDRADRILSPVVEGGREPGQFTAREYLRNVNWGRAEALMKLGRFAEAVPSWERAIALDDGPRRAMMRQQMEICLARSDPAATRPATRPSAP